jgi:hypothetical protein
MSAKQDGMVRHYAETYDATYRYEYQRNRLFVTLILILIASTYLAFDKEIAQVTLTFLISQLPTASTEAVQNAIKKVNFYRVFSVVAILAVFYLIVNLHHRLATIKRNYRYLAKLEGELREELGIGEGKVFFTRESTFYRDNKPTFFWFARVSYSIILIAFVLLFLSVRLWSDRPEKWPDNWVEKWADLSLYRQITYDQLLFVFDCVLTLPIVLGLLAYIVQTFRR